MQFQRLACSMSYLHNQNWIVDLRTKSSEIWNSVKKILMQHFENLIMIRLFFLFLIYIFFLFHALTFSVTILKITVKATNLMKEIASNSFSV